MNVKFKKDVKVMDIISKIFKKYIFPRKMIMECLNQVSTFASTCKSTQIQPNQALRPQLSESGE